MPIGRGIVVGFLLNRFGAPIHISYQLALGSTSRSASFVYNKMASFFFCSELLYGTSLQVQHHRIGAITEKKHKQCAYAGNSENSVSEIDVRRNTPVTSHKISAIHHVT
jgi:hypothetical protein